MKGQVKLSLAVALALASGSAFALGLGTIQVKSGLNQPLDAEIPVIAESPAEVSALTVDLASAEDFERVGLNRSRLTVPIEMSVATNARGQTVIKLTTKEAVREPLIDFLIQANWSKGKVLREYTVLLDPPVTAPAAKGSTATVAPVAEKPAAAPQPLAPSKAPAKTERPQPKPPVAAAPQKPAPAPAPPAPAPKPAAHAANGNDYGPVAAGETLSEIARATRPDEKTNINQMMLALLKANPNAFYQDNINALKRGAILRIPNSDDIRSAASVREAVTQVHSQNDSWSGKAPVSTPTLVAHTGGTDSTGAKNPKTEPAAGKQERLALVPPQNGKNQSSADRAGAAGGTSKDMADAKAELARTKEALTSREQEATELKSRVKQLEEIGSKDQKLLTMKNSEIADLQNKLKELQAKAAAAPPATAAKPADSASKTADASTAGKGEQKVTAKDIWGDLSPSDKAAPAKAGSSATAATSAPAATTATPGASTTPASSATTSASATTPTPAATAPSSTSPAATTAAATSASSPSSSSASTASPPAAATSAPSATTPSSTASTGGATVTPLPSSTSSTSTTPAASTPAATASTDTGSPASSMATSATTPAKSVTAAKVSPLEPSAEPFYKNQNVLLGGGAALLLVGLLALMRFMRKPKPFVAPVETDGEFAQTDEEEQRLLETLQHEPGNTTASLELLRHYYAQGDAARFETAAEQMHAHLMDPGAPEWDEVLAMGAVLVPNNPLFGEAGGSESADLHSQPSDEFSYTDAMHTQAFDDAALHTEHAVHATPDAAFEYDLPPQVDVAREEAASNEHTLTDFSLHAEPHAEAQHSEVHRAEAQLPEHDFHMEQHLPEHAPEPEQHVEQVAETTHRADELFVGEDAIGTKLDLAKAYLDMGDPEGAKSMLDEVMSEGDATQQDEARKLLAEIR